MQKPSRKTVSAKSLTFDMALNVREENRYKLDIMAEQICAVGKIIEPLVVEELPSDKGVVIRVLKGNRRGRAALMMLENPQMVLNILLAMAEQETDLTKQREMKDHLADHQKEILEGLTKIDVVVYKDLTTDEREEMIMDHGTVLQLCRTECVKCIWRKKKLGKSDSEIIRSMYSTIANYTGNFKKLAEVEAITDPRAKERALQTWLHGTVGNQILAALYMGPYVQEQFILSRRQEDRLLGPDEKVELFCSRDRITQLSAAKTADKDSKKGGKGWDSEKGGEQFNKLLKQFKDEDAGVTAKVEVKRPSLAELNRKQDAFLSSPAKLAFKIAAGEPADLMAADEAAYRLEKVSDILAAQWASFPEPTKTLVTHLLNDTPLKFEEFVKELLAH